jgi:hypothetical protein
LDLFLFFLSDWLFLVKIFLFITFDAIELNNSLIPLPSFALVYINIALFFFAYYCASAVEISSSRRSILLPTIANVIFSGPLS